MASVDDRVKVKRDNGDVIDVSRNAWNGVYQYRKGYTLVDEHPDLSKKTREDLDAIAVERGIDPSDFPKKADLLAALEGSE